MSPKSMEKRVKKANKMAFFFSRCARARERPATSRRIDASAVGVTSDFY
jgi:hypothetical protein